MNEPACQEESVAAGWAMQMDHHMGSAPSVHETEARCSCGADVWNRPEQTCMQILVLKVTQFFSHGMVASQHVLSSADLKKVHADLSSLSLLT